MEFAGEFVDGMPVGSGMVTNNKGDVYIGEVKGLAKGGGKVVVTKHGKKGVEIKFAGESFLGEFANDLRNGPGENSSHSSSIQ